MQCPRCNIPLVMSDRQGVEIDYCPQCRGVWLDRGEMDKIVEREASYSAPQAASPTPPFAANRDRADRDRSAGDRDRYADRDRYDRDDDDYAGGRRKKRGWLGELFDFD